MLLRATGTVSDSGHPRPGWGVLPAAWLPFVLLRATGTVSDSGHPRPGWVHLTAPGCRLCSSEPRELCLIQNTRGPAVSEATVGLWAVGGAIFREHAADENYPLW